jgi:hypothetical protein
MPAAAGTTSSLRNTPRQPGFAQPSDRHHDSDPQPVKGARSSPTILSCTLTAAAMAGIVGGARNDVPMMCSRLRIRGRFARCGSRLLCSPVLALRG